MYKYNIIVIRECMRAIGNFIIEGILDIYNYSYICICI